MVKRKLTRRSRIAIGVLSVSILALVYVFQGMNYLYFFFPKEINPNVTFIFNKTLRLLINDLLCVILIFALFEEKKYVKVAFLILMVELVIILPFYFLIKLKMEGDSEISSPLLSQVHRLIINPMLMFILIAGFYYQKFFSVEGHA